jgi:hypothetical protein
MSQLQYEFANELCTGTIETGEYTHQDVTLSLMFNDIADDGKVYYIAAAPADHRHSFSGSGLPFPSEEAAFQGTPNKGMITVREKVVHSLKLFLPNAYYSDFNGTLVNPYVLFQFTSGGQLRKVKVDLGQAIPYRSLTHPKKRQSPMFYEKGWSLPVRTQEQVLRHSGYPVLNMEAPDFWGLRPPHP